MPTIVGILTLSSRINTTSEKFEHGKNPYFSVFYFLRAVDISCSAELSMKKFYNLAAQTMKNIRLFKLACTSTLASTSTLSFCVYPVTKKTLEMFSYI